MLCGRTQAIGWLAALRMASISSRTALACSLSKIGLSHAEASVGLDEVVEIERGEPSIIPGSH